MSVAAAVPSIRQPSQCGGQHDQRRKETEQGEERDLGGEATDASFDHSSMMSRTNRYDHRPTARRRRRPDAAHSLGPRPKGTVPPMDSVAACTNVLLEIAEAMDAAAYDTLESLLEHAALVDGRAARCSPRAVRQRSPISVRS